MCLGYGNPLYEGGGQPALMGGVPTSDEALAAWVRWVRASVARYRDVIREWEVWNEPNYRVKPADYARLFILTAEAIRAEQPRATIIAFGLGSGVDYRYADAVLAIVQAQGKIDLIDQISHHRHQLNPDRDEPEIELEKVARRYSDRIVIRQGEAGCPSEPNARFAMRNHPWTELIQAKHVLRRLLADLGRGKQSSVFTIIDMKYPDEMNRKGLLRAREDLTVEYPKPAYYAVQNLASAFDDRLARIAGYPVETPPGLPLSIHGYEHRASGGHVVAIWFNDKVPGDDNARTPVDFTFARGRFGEPVYVDLRTGFVYGIPPGNWRREGDAHRFRAVPCYDSPILIADRTALFITP